MPTIKTSLITTVLNEEKTIGNFIDSISKQTQLPSEVIIVDGGSIDKTIEIIRSKAKQYNELFKIILSNKKGNRSIGRNEGIKKSSNKIILLTDSGNLLDKNWVKNITKHFEENSTQVVAGYYKGTHKNIFQKSLIPYALVMEDKIDENDFLPATRSMALRKSVWKKLGGFDNKLSHNEDYAFAKKIKASGIEIYFAKNAIVNWIPRKNLKDAFIMFFRFAMGDTEANIIREKVVYLFLRYFVALYIVLLSLIMRSIYLYCFIVVLFLSYIVWSIWKNYKYVKNYKAFMYLPILQFTSDVAVLSGSIVGLIKPFSFKKLVKIILNNKGALIVVLMYISVLLFTISYGLPNSNHPFDYFMDEWHQSQSIRNLFKYGSPNVSGAANGSIFQFFLTGIYLIPFYIAKFIDPFAIKSSVLNLDLQTRFFEILRLNTLLFGTFSIILFAYIAKKFFKINSFLSAFLFAISPVWIMLSGFYKYDIALIFWILVSLLFLLRYIDTKSRVNFILAGFFCAISLSTKLSALPLIPIYLLTIILFTPNIIRKIKYLFLGSMIFLGTFLAFGIPDQILGKGSVNEYFSTNISSLPLAVTNNFVMGKDYLQFLFTRNYFTVLGHGFYLLFIVAVFLGTILFIYKNNSFKKIINSLKGNRNYLYLLIFSTFFAISLFPLRLTGSGNRLLVLLPFFVITTGIFVEYIQKTKNNLVKGIVIFLLIVTFSVQLAETFTWVKFKVNQDPRVTSSLWMQENVKSDFLIGIENIPIYQMLPDVIVKEFYLEQYKVTNKNKFRYQIIDSKTSPLPKVIVLSNEVVESKYYVVSDKKELLKRLKAENYKLIKQFRLDFRYFKLFGDDLDFSFSGILLTPTTISIYEK